MRKVTQILREWRQERDFEMEFFFTNYWQSFNTIKQKKGLLLRSSQHKIPDIQKFSWKGARRCEIKDTHTQAKYLAQSYPKDIDEEQFVQESQHFKMCMKVE